MPDTERLRALTNKERELLIKVCNEDNYMGDMSPIDAAGLGGLQQLGLVDDIATVWLPIFPKIIAAIRVPVEAKTADDEIEPEYFDDES